LHYRVLDDIGRRSVALLEKGKLARVLDKGRDSEEVIKLIEKLRQAILVYQVGAKLGQKLESLIRCAGIAAAVNIQQSDPIDRRFLPPFYDFKTESMTGQL
jgi:hypothetical protein